MKHETIHVQEPSKKIEVNYLNSLRYFRLKRGEDAVSPVVGVMLMLVVTIIIAAVVSAFAGGLGGTQQKTPQASIQIKTGYVVNDSGYLDTSKYDLSFEHMGGDPIMTKETQLITYLTVVNGTVVRHVQTGVSNVSCAGTGGTPPCSRPPHVSDNQKYGFPCGPASLNSPAWFGNAVWMPGDIARTYQLHYTAEVLGVSDEDLTAAISNHAQLEVKLMHVPSGKYIVDQKVNLQ